MSRRWRLRRDRGGDQPPAACGSDHGESLIELIIGITVLGIVSISIGAGVTLSVLVSDQHRKQTTADYFLHNYAEAIQSASYTTCTSGVAPNYVTIAGLATPTSFSAPSQTAIKFWNGTAFVTGCPGTDLGLQQVTLKLTSTDGRASESIVVVVRKP